jgi:hypothetical protein
VGLKKLKVWRRKDKHSFELGDVKYPSEWTQIGDVNKARASKKTAIMNYARLLFPLPTKEGRTKHSNSL